jgi:hypothetical protein
MKLWFLTQAHVTGYDVTRGVVVRAENEVEARILASTVRGDEGTATWLDDAKSICVELLAEGVAEVILQDFNAG